MSIKINYHLLLCATPSKGSCCDYKDGQSSWNQLKKIISELNLDDPTRPEGVVLRSKVDCLRVCKNGPILLTWPDGIWYQKVSPKLIELIIKQHIVGGQPIADFIYQRTPLKALDNMS